MTIKEKLDSSAQLLKEKNIDGGRLNVELMLSEILGCRRMDLYLEFDKPLKTAEEKLIDEYIERRINHEPLQYILAKSIFYGLEFKVNRSVLIPRPETELLVEKILNDIKDSGAKEVKIFEVGCGSGCISVTIAKKLKEFGIFFEIFSIDVSQDAVDLSIENLKFNSPDEVGVRFYTKDVFEIDKLTKSFDYIISNPPYIPVDDYMQLDAEVKEFEPDISLTDFGNGLKFYEQIFLIASNSELKVKIFCEIGFGQKAKLEDQLSKYNFRNVCFHKDYNNIYRILEVEV